MLRISTLLSLALLVGCAADPVDTDKDGLNDDDEANLGTDPKLADSDGDTLNDGDEVDLGTDPLVADTDGDSYLDGWEVTEGKDPLDATSVIYQMGWPYNPNKAQYADRTWDNTGNQAGDKLAMFEYMDQKGDMVNIYDLADQGKPIMIDIAAMWCGPCQGIAKWLSGTSDPYDWNSIAPHVVDAVENGDIYWVTILGDDLGSQLDNQYPTGDVDSDELAQWESAFSDPNVPLLADQADPDEVAAYSYKTSSPQSAPQGYAVTHLLANAWPTTVLFDEHLEVTTGPGDPSGMTFYQPIMDLEAMLADGTVPMQ